MLWSRRSAAHGIEGKLEVEVPTWESYEPRTTGNPGTYFSRTRRASLRPGRTIDVAIAGLSPDRCQASRTDSLVHDDVREKKGRAARGGETRSKKRL